MKTSSVLMEEEMTHLKVTQPSITIPQEHGLQTSNVNSWVTPLWLSLKRN